MNANEVRRAPSGRTFVVVGDGGDGEFEVAGAIYRYLEPHTSLIETSGRWAGSKFSVPTQQVERWEVVS
jgi:hypothetical protein